MKREILQNIKVYPYTSEDVIEREDFISGILGVKVGTPTGSPTGLAIKLTITESDAANGTFTAASDKNVILDKTPLDENGSIVVDTDVVGGELVNFDLDLIGCKNFIKVKVEAVCTGGTSAACTVTSALALGDSKNQPV